MARKNTKTNHVLNLLAGNGEMEEPLEEKRQENPPEVSEAANVNIQVVGSQKEDEKIVNTVNELLEKELEEEFAEEGLDESETAMKPEEPVEVAAVEPEPEEPVAAAEPEPEEPVVAVEPEPEEPVEVAAVEPEPEEPVAAAEPEPEPEPEKPVAAAEPKPEETADSLELIDPQDIITVGLEPDYRFVNVMEKLVQEKVMFYMKQFGNCTCSRCVADTIALTLTHLPPKYEVIDRNAVAPLLNFYSQQYMGQITVEITKACTRVNEHPHHGRD